MKDLPVRKKIRLRGYDYSTPGYYHITLCIKNGHEMLGTVDVGAATCRPSVQLSDVGKITNDSINNIPKIYPNIFVDKYVIMSNHIHMILHIVETKIKRVSNLNGRQVAAPTVQRVIGNMKRNVSMQIGFSIWQKSFHDEIIKNEESYHNIWHYINNNPAKWADDDYFKREN